MTKAFIYSARGPPSKVLKLVQDYKVPPLEDDFVRVQVKAAGLNPVDWKLMKYMPIFIGKRPAVAGSDYSGTVLESRSPLFQPGDEVYGLVHSLVKIERGFGSVAQEIVAPAKTCAKRPESLRPAVAAGLSLVGLTAVELANLLGDGKIASKDNANKRVLVCGGSSSVGMTLISILKDRGYFVATTCSNGKINLVKERGADVTFDYREKDFIENLSAFTESEGQFHGILDCADSYNVWMAGETLLDPTRPYVNVGADLSQGILPLLRKMVSYFLWPAWLGGVARQYKRPGDFATRANMDIYDDLLKRGVIKPLVDSEFTFDKTVEAYEYLMRNRATGKVIVNVAE